MKNRRLYFGILTILLAGISVAVVVALRSPREPAFEGRLLSEWLTDLRSQNAETRSKATGALRQMGPQTVSFLVADLNRHDSFLKARTIAFLQMVPSIRQRLMSEGQRHQRSISALGQLKPHSKAVITALNAHLLNTNTGIAALNALIPVGESQPIGVEFVESLIIALGSVDFRVRVTAASEMTRVPKNNRAAIAALRHSLGDSNKSVQLHAALALTKICTTGSVAVPAYIKLWESDRGFERIAINGCVMLETQAVAAVPMLIEAAEMEDNEVRRHAVYALGRVHSDARRVIPFLVALLEDYDSIVARNAAYAIGAFGKEASNAIPALLKAKESKHEQVREAADYVIKNMLSPARLRE